MKKLFTLILITLLTLHLQAQVTITPANFNVTDEITITVSIAPQSCNSIVTSTPKVYMHAGIGNDANAFGFSVVGNWGQDDGVGEMTNMGNNNWTITIVPSDYFNLTETQQNNATKIGMVFRNPNGAQELKLPPTCADFIFDVGAFQVSLQSPENNSSTIISSGGSLLIQATNTGANAAYVLKANGVTINTNNATTSYSFEHINITENQVYQLEVTQGTATIVRNFSVIVNPLLVTEALPENVENGINYIDDDPTKAILVLDAPLKDFVYVAGSFNQWQPGQEYAMKKDPNSTKFWLALEDLIPGEIYTYQYWVVANAPIANSPNLVKTADPFSTLVLSQFDDPWIPESSYPNLPPFPQGQEREVTVLQTGQTPFEWSEATLNFVKPDKEDLVFYEVLIRDFDANRRFQDLIDRIDYFKDLNINAIKLMPVMEFEGNESWGYNTSFHMALDKFYGTEDKLKEFIDLCHQHGIAVVLDLAINHAFGRNPLVRMWMNDPQNTGWGDPSNENPYFNTVPMHSYNVGSDFNHQQERTQYYTKRVVKHWIENFKIDGIRWDLTKGFTQNCPPGPNQESCTNAYQQDRVDLLKDYADYSWSLDPDHYVIFEHLGTDAEEREWADYRLNEGKGVMLWGIMTHNYNQLTRGFASTITRAGHLSRGFAGKRLIAYAESHDEERIMYNNLISGNTNGHNAANLETALFRMQALGAALFTIPGPKMIWHFSELGMENSIFTCSNGTVNTPNDATPGDCKLDTKPQPQWENQWMNVPSRRQIYDTWAKLILFKTQEPVFKGDYSILPDGNNLRQRIYVWNDDLATTVLKNVVVLVNFSVTDQNFNPNFPYTGDWYNLMDNSVLNVTNTTAAINVPAGSFKMFGNMPSPLSIDDVSWADQVVLSPNPVVSDFSINTDTQSVSLYTLTGQLVKHFEGNFNAFSHFNIQELRPGLYMVKIQNDQNQIKTMKIIKH